MAESRLLPCPECGTENTPSSAFCESCGLRLVQPAASEEADAAPVEPRSGRRKRRLQSGEKTAIVRQLAKARRLVASVRGAYWVLAVMGALVTLAAYALASKDPDRWFGFALALALTLALVGGALFSHLHPLAWTVALAGLWTIDSVLGLVDGQVPVLSLLITLSLWCVVPLMLNVQRLMREHPDLIDTSKLKKRERKEGVDVSEARLHAEARRRQRAKSQLKSFATVAGIVVAIVFGIWLVMKATGKDGGNTARAASPPALSDTEASRIAELLEPRIGEFERVWAATDLDTLEAMFTDDKQETSWPKVLGTLQKRGWHEQLPSMTGVPDYFPRGQIERDVFFDLLPKGQLKTRWRFEDEAWKIDRFVFSHTR
jgi:hypothetical protein